jgi:hypothetical protein
MKKLLLFLVSFTAVLNVKSQEYIHIYDKADSVSGAISTKIMTDRIKESAKLYLQNAPIPRFTQLDYAFGADASEHKKLNGNGVLYLPSLNNDASEYPIKKVYAKTPDGIVELKKIGEINVGNTDPEIIKVFGKNRVDYYYFLPYKLTKINCEILIDWNTNRKEFVLTKFPNGSDQGFSTQIKGDESIDFKFLAEFLKREFNVEPGK